MTETPNDLVNQPPASGGGETRPYFAPVHPLPVHQVLGANVLAQSVSRETSASGAGESAEVPSVHFVKRSQLRTGYPESAASAGAPIEEATPVEVSQPVATTASPAAPTAVTEPPAPSAARSPFAAPAPALPSHIDPHPSAPPAAHHPVHRHPGLATPLPTHTNPIEHRPVHPESLWRKKGDGPGQPQPNPYGPPTAAHHGQPVQAHHQPAVVLRPQPGQPVQAPHGHNQVATRQYVAPRHPVPVYSQNPLLPEPPYVSAHNGPPRKSSNVLAIAASALIAAMLASAITAAALHVFTPTGRNFGNSGVSIGDIGPVHTPAPIDPGQVDPGLIEPGGFAAPDWESVAAQVADSVVSIQVMTDQGGSVGSGFVLDTVGNVLTNAHVVAGSPNGNVQVTLADGRLFMGNVVGSDRDTDLAVVLLQNPPANLQPVRLGDSTTLRVGSPVLAVGNPLGLANTVTQGIVSALNRPVTANDGSPNQPVTTNAIQIDAAINPGNSGGPLFNSVGQVVGVTSSIASLTAGLGGQGGSIGLGFAIPVNLAKNIAAQLIEHGEAELARLGVMLEGAPATVTVNGVTRRGARIGQVMPNTAASAAGIETGDVVVAFNDLPVTGSSALTGLVRERHVGDHATLLIVRGDQAMEKDIVLGSTREQAVVAPPAPEAPAEPEDDPAPADGEDG